MKTAKAFFAIAAALLAVSIASAPALAWWPGMAAGFGGFGFPGAFGYRLSGLGGWGFPGFGLGLLGFPWALGCGFPGYGGYGFPGYGGYGLPGAGCGLGYPSLGYGSLVNAPLMK